MRKGKIFSKTGLPTHYRVKLSDNGVVYYLFNLDGQLGSSTTAEAILEMCFECPSMYEIIWDVNLELGKSYKATDGKVYKMDSKSANNMFRRDIWNCHYRWNGDGYSQNGPNLIKEVTSTLKPSLGLAPVFTWKEPRIQSIKEAINRKIDNLEEIPVEWISEYNTIRNIGK